MAPTSHGLEPPGNPGRFNLIGQRLREFRIRAGLSQSKLARKIDVADATIQRIEAGESTTSATIQLILDELGHTGAELLCTPS